MLEAARRDLNESRHWGPILDRIDRLRRREAFMTSSSDGVVEISFSEPLDREEKQELNEIVELLIPWRSGPIRLHDILIDAEWNSNRKWDRIAPFLSDITGKHAADVGCGNGYFMFRMQSLKPASVTGFDPGPSAWLQFSLLQHCISSPGIRHYRLGTESLHFFREAFDAVLCAGVLYHRRDPLGTLASLRTALKPGGKLVLESMTVHLEGSIALCPAGRYGKMGNVWFVPTEMCLEAWLVRAGFRRVRKALTWCADFDEQRQTKYAPFESLSDFLMKDDPSRTVEGDPAPQRTIFEAFRDNTGSS